MALGMLSGKDDKDDIDEENAVKQHKAYYNNDGGNNSNQSGGSGNMGAAAAMQAMKMFNQGNSGSGKSGQNQLIGIAMGEAAKLFGTYFVRVRCIMEFNTANTFHRPAKRQQQRPQRLFQAGRRHLCSSDGAQDVPQGRQWRWCLWWLFRWRWWPPQHGQQVHEVELYSKS